MARDTQEVIIANGPSQARVMTFGATLADGEGGLPGPLNISVTCKIDADGAVGIEIDRLAMTLETDAPGLQIYDASRLDASPAAGHQGAPYGAHAGLALEPQSWPDAPNHPEFPQITLRPRAVFRQSTRFFFTVKDRP